MAAAKIRVITVDDSPFMRDLITQIVNAEVDMQVVAAAEDAFDAREKIKQLSPDVVLLDIEMPRMDGLTFLEKIMRLRPMPVVMVSTLTVAGAKATLQALAAGAVDFVTKPAARVDGAQVDAFAADLADKVRIAAAAADSIARRGVGPASTALASVAAGLSTSARNAVVAIGASTGGIEAITTVMSGLPREMPPILIVQHLPQPFTRLFASRLNGLCALKVKEAENGDILHPGHAYIAPGDHHLRLGRGVSGWVALLGSDPPLGGHRPAVDHLFLSVANLAGKQAVGVILSGMGADGAAGLLAMRKSGALTVGQDAATCVVYGMPRAAFETGAVQRVVPLGGVASAILSNLQAIEK